MTEKLNVSEISDMDLVNIVNQTEGLSWRMNHDAGDGRIPNEGVDDSITELRKTRDEAVAEITKRTGITEFPVMREYVQKKLKEQDEMWDTQWSEIYNEGAVFRPTKNKSLLLETIRTYLPTRGTMGPKEYIFARSRGTLSFRDFDDRSIVKFVKVPEVKSLYTNVSPEQRGLIKLHEEPNKRNRKMGDTIYSREDEKYSWKDFSSWDHTVFYHKGFDEKFEVMDKYNLPYVDRCNENEIILTRSHDRPVFVEFSRNDLEFMKVLYEQPKYKQGEIFNLEKM